MRGAPPVPIHRLAVGAVVLLQLAVSAATLVRQPWVSAHEPSRVFAGQQLDDIRMIRGSIPDDEPLLYVTDDADSWLPRLWERALSPQPVAIVVVPPGGDAAAAAGPLRQRLRIRWALSAGSPPPDPGFRRRVALPPLPGSPVAYAFGPLAER